MEQVLVQRGVVAFSLSKHNLPQPAYFAEHWLSPPLEVAGTSAAALALGVRRFWPAWARFTDLDVLRRLVSAGATFTFMPLCDKGSGNLLLMKKWGHFWESIISADLDVGHRVLYFPDVCSVHMHHRAKLQVQGLKEHTMRHYSVANLLRLSPNLRAPPGMGEGRSPNWAPGRPSTWR